MAALHYLILIILIFITISFIAFLTTFVSIGVFAPIIAAFGGYLIFTQRKIIFKQIDRILKKQ